MIAFFGFFALMTACIVACVYISTYRLHARKGTGYLTEHQFVRLNQGALIGRRSHKQQRARLDTGMGECVQRVAGISLAVVAVVVVLVIAFFSIAF